jgi:hypothetical protein
MAVAVADTSTQYKEMDLVDHDIVIGHIIAAQNCALQNKGSLYMVLKRPIHILSDKPLLTAVFKAFAGPRYYTSVLAPDSHFQWTVLIYDTMHKNWQKGRPLYLRSGYVRDRTSCIGYTNMYVVPAVPAAKTGNAAPVLGRVGAAAAGALASHPFPSVRRQAPLPVSP